VAIIVVLVFQTLFAICSSVLLLSVTKHHQAVLRLLMPTSLRAYCDWIGFPSAGYPSFEKARTQNGGILLM